MLAIARERYPALTVPADEYLAYLAQRARGDVHDHLDAIDPAELYVVCACAHGEHRAQRRFEAEYFGEIRVGASRLRCTPDELDEIQQAVRLALFARGDDGRISLVHKTARGDLRAFIRLMALRAGISLRRTRGHALVDDEALLDMAAGDTPGAVVMAKEHRAKFRVALAAAVERLEPKQRGLLRLHEVDGLSTATIARMYQVDRSTISRWLARARATILELTRRELAERHGVGRQHFESFIDVIRSNFAASIHRVLAANEGDAHG